MVTLCARIYLGWWIPVADTESHVPTLPATQLLLLLATQGALAHPRDPAIVMNALRQFIGLPAGRRALLGEAALLLTCAEIVTRIAGGARLARLLGRSGAAAAETPTEEGMRLAREVSWAVAAAVRHLPWQPVCLPQALAARWLLQRRLVRSTLYLGVAGARRRAAHAWVCVGALVVTGADQMDGCTVVSTFA